MGSGIVSSALLLTGHRQLSVPVLVIACVLWTDLAAVLAERLVVDPAAVRRGEHVPAALTAVAGTAVLGARFTAGGTPAVGWVALGLAAGLWLVLLRPVLAALPRHGAPGAAFLLTVATASLAVLLAGLSRADEVRWLVVPGAALVAIALLLYIDVLRRFAARRELVHGHGDQWVAGGALAICVLATAALSQASSGPAHAVLRDIALGLGVMSVVWLAVLSATEIAHPRLTYDERRWATVFPLGMYAAAGATLGATVPSEPVATAARAWVWVATAAWTVVLVGLLRRTASKLEGD
jgi:tellurite resistance protein TehA-like permease